MPKPGTRPSYEPQLVRQAHELGCRTRSTAHRSRNSLSRLLTEAGKRGIVEIRVHHSQQIVAAPEAELAQRYGLKGAPVMVRRTRDRGMVLREVAVLCEADP